MSEFIKDTLPVLRQNIDFDIRVETDLSPDTSRVEADLTQMQMVLSAVLSNAAEAIDGEGCIQITTGEKEMDEEFIKEHLNLKAGRYVRIRIKDDGKGMDEATRSKVFEPFFTTKFQGRGLSMAAAYGIVRNHGGWISLDSELGSGSVVCIYLPAIASVQSKGAGLTDLGAMEGKQVQNTKFARARDPKTALVIEDEERLRYLSRIFLENLGYHVLISKNGAEAVKIVRTFEGNIDFALLDIRLPDMQGDEIYQIIRETRPNLKVIICSGYCIDGPVQKILDAGAEGFLQKPFSLTGLSEKLKDVMD